VHQIFQQRPGRDARHDQIEAIHASQVHENHDGKRHGDEVAEVSNSPHHPADKLEVCLIGSPRRHYDQGSQFTGSAFTSVLADNGIAISMDGKGAWRDNVFVERLWRSVKYEEVYLRAYETVSEARHSLGRYLDFYNGRRPHSSLDDMTPDQAYFNIPLLRAAA
jgi:transposase InsO family protein